MRGRFAAMDRKSLCCAWERSDKAIEAQYWGRATVNKQRLVLGKEQLVRPNRSVMKRKRSGYVQVQQSHEQETSVDVPRWGRAKETEGSSVMRPWKEDSLATDPRGHIQA